MRHLNKSGAASALILALVAGIVAAASSGVAAVTRHEAAPVAAPAAADPLEALFDHPSKDFCAARVADLAAVVANDNDPRHAQAIVALALAGTDSSRDALRAIVAHGSAADADHAQGALGGSAVP